MVSLTSLEVPDEGGVSGGSLPSSWWGVFHSFSLWMNNGLCYRIMHMLLAETAFPSRQPTLRCFNMSKNLQQLVPLSCS